MKIQTSRLRHEPPCDRVAFFVTFQNLRKAQGRSERLETTYPLAFKSIGAGKTHPGDPSSLCTLFSCSTGYFAPRVEGVGGLVD